MIEKTMLSVMDLRRSPTKAPLIHRVNKRSDLKKVLTFKFYVGDLFLRNPIAHMWLITDGYIAASEPRKSLQGRGVTIGHTNQCNMGVGFEMFGENSGYPNKCMPVKFIPNEFYDIRIETTKTEIFVFVKGPNINETAHFKFSKQMPSYDTVIGVADDLNSSTYGFFNLLQQIG